MYIYKYMYICMDIHMTGSNNISTYKLVPVYMYIYISYSIHILFYCALQTPNTSNILFKFP